jgi:hypothetical protein
MFDGTIPSNVSKSPQNPDIHREPGVGQRAIAGNSGQCGAAMVAISAMVAYCFLQLAEPQVALLERIPLSPPELHQ